MNEVEIDIPPENLEDNEFIKNSLIKKLKITAEELESIVIVKRSLDARAKPVYKLRIKYLLKDDVKDKQFEELNLSPTIKELPNVKDQKAVIVVGSGPAGLFAAYKLVSIGLKPIVVERGSEIRKRRLDLAKLMKQGILNPESNYCFGEGGAGTFSDGKLYTRSHKRGSIKDILSILTAHGADKSILIDAHPHIGTNKLPKIITSIKEHLINKGAIFHFDTKVLSIKVNSNKIKGVETNKGTIEAEALILATGHSARDIFYMLDQVGAHIEAKSFALGVRIEHPQEFINETQYRKYNNKNLPPASYALACQAKGVGVYSFCMCPGGIICPASTEENAVVVNGWSPSSRNSYFANSGLVVEVPIESLLTKSMKQKSTLNAFVSLEFQKEIEEKAYLAGGGKFKAPAQRINDFIKNKTSETLPINSYKPGLTSFPLDEILPNNINESLKEGLTHFIKQRPILGSSEGIMVGVESRTSSPIRVSRDENGMSNIEGLFPCGEGAGYAGGIISAALDGENIAQHVKKYLG